MNFILYQNEKPVLWSSFLLFVFKFLFRKKNFFISMYSLCGLGYPDKPVECRRNSQKKFYEILRKLRNQRNSCESRHNPKNAKSD